MLRHLPNVLSFLRIFLSPIFLYYCFIHEYTVALVLFFIAGMTDWADGFTARFFGVESDFGKLLDPVADKVLLIVAYIGFYFLGKLPLWIVCLVIGRDVLILLCALITLLKKWPYKLDVQFISKINTAFQMLLIGGIILLGEGHWLIIEILYLTGLTTIISGFSYARHFQKWYTSYQA